MENGRPVGCSLLMDSGILREPRPTSGSARDMRAWKELSITDGPSKKPTCVPSRSISRRARPWRSPFWTCRTARKRGCSGRPTSTPREYMASISTWSGHLARMASRSSLSSWGRLAAQPPGCRTRVASTCVETMLSSGSAPSSLSTSRRPSGHSTSRSSTGSSSRPSARRRTRGFAKPRPSTHHASCLPTYSAQPARIISR
mmetsp:Transcript_104023/g.275031  ORF Transcript_104023/g.275031 Transcript_104023/m.275031 type:complete len:201 (+) Transcript_104023:184-786(+)